MREKAQAQVSRLKSKRITALPTSSSSKNNTGTRISAAGTGMEVAPPPESPISSPATAKRGKFGKFFLLKFDLNNNKTIETVEQFLFQGFAFAYASEDLIEKNSNRSSNENTRNRENKY